jgi:hypothetical protein
MCMAFVTIVVEFAAMEWPRQQEPRFPPGPPIHLVELQTDAARTFTLFHRGRSVYTLTAGEADELRRLVQQVAVTVPAWEPMLGFDGITYTLTLKGPMSDVTFSWWMEVPEGWESVSAVADSVLCLVDRLGLSRYG